MNIVSSTFSSKDDIHSAFSRLKKVTQQNAFPSAQERRQGLIRLQASLMDHETVLLEALRKDFGTRAHEESRLIELVPLLGEIKHAKRYLAKWMKPSKRHVHISTLPASNTG